MRAPGVVHENRATEPAYRPLIHGRARGFFQNNKNKNSKN
jgi:hypothetical protein